jgi:hypothetical protein
MRIEIRDQLGIEFPHLRAQSLPRRRCRGQQGSGFGVLGAVTFTPEQLAEELDWIDQQIGDRPYGNPNAAPEVRITPAGQIKSVRRRPTWCWTWRNSTQKESSGSTPSANAWKPTCRTVQHDAV